MVEPDAGAVKARCAATRLEAFVDAAFAFAVTLLVVSFGAMPHSLDEFLLAMKGVPAFACSFALLCMLWWGHVRWSQRYALPDRTGLLLSLLLVFLVLIYVYPLRVLFSSFFAFLSGGWLRSEFQVRDLDDLAGMFASYAVAWGTLGLVMVSLYRHAWRRRDLLGLDAEERADLRSDIAVWWMIPVTGLLSLLASAVLYLAQSQALVMLPGLAYMGMLASGWAASRARRRALADEPAT